MLKNKGITLIALVITIIILLILAGISISALTNQGLFKNAKAAQNATEKAEEEQGQRLNEYEDEINKYFGISNMPIVSSQYWNMVHGNNPEEVLKDEEGMQTMRTLGNNMAWLLKSIEAGKKAGIKLPENESIISTNFIR